MLYRVVPISGLVGLWAVFPCGGTIPFTLSIFRKALPLAFVKSTIKLLFGIIKQVAFWETVNRE